MQYFNDLSIEIQIIISAIFLINIIALSCILFIKFSRGKNIKTCIIDIIMCVLNVILHVGYQYLYRIKFEQASNLKDLKLLNKIPVTLIWIFIIFTIVYITYDYIMERKDLKNKLDAYSIKETLDNLKIGICFSNLSGQLVLTNKKMFEIVDSITGSSLSNANSFWSCMMDDKWEKYAKRISDEEYIYKLNDNSIWKFEKTKLNVDGEDYIQIICSDVTYIYNLTIKLKTNNEKLDKQQERLKNLLKNITVVTQEEEVLMSKIRVHDSLGRSILSTRRFLVQERDISQSKQIIDMWKNIINRFDASITNSENTNDNTKEQIIDIAAMLGCEVVFEGKFPNDTDIQYLMLTIVREAITNAVRHVKAKKVFVILNENKYDYNITIFDDNNKKINMQEGCGLSNLRHKVENVGGNLIIDGNKGIKISAVFSKGENYV